MLNKQVSLFIGSLSWGETFQYLSFRPKPVFIGVPMFLAALLVKLMGTPAYLFFQAGCNASST